MDGKPGIGAAMNQPAHSTVDFLETGQGPLVVLVHSSVAGARQWRRLMTDLESRFRSRAVNLYGYGGTPPWPNERRQTLSDQAMLLEQIIPDDARAITIIGHSFGGSVAMKAALRFGPRVSRLVLFEPNPFYLLRLHGRLDAFAEVVALRDWVKRYGTLGDWAAVAERFADYWNGPGSWESMPAERRAAFANATKPVFFEWDTAMEETTTPTLTQLATSLPARTLLITAANTQRPLREIAELLREACPHWSFEQVPDGGHMAPLTRPDLVNPIVMDFLRQG